MVSRELPIRRPGTNVLVHRLSINVVDFGTLRLRLTNFYDVIII